MRAASTEMPTLPEPASPLIAPKALAALFGHPDLVVLDIRSAVDGGGRAAYDAGHVPGAVHTDYVAGGWRVARDGGAGMLPDADALAALLGGLSIRPESPRGGGAGPGSRRATSRRRPASTGR